MVDDDIEGSREERAFRQWINSLGIEDVFINNLYEDLRDGLVLLKVIHKINPTLVSWEKVAKKPRNIFDKGHNCELALNAAKQMKQIKLREYNIVQPDYAKTPGATLVYHQDRLTQIHEESCKSYVKTIAGDLLPE